ncbi:MAG TPA: hypothetical protein PK268_08950, partial [Enterococcus sp.]|nr:hypothetical protein [Enterococcus sp.]
KKWIFGVLVGLIIFGGVAYWSIGQKQQVVGKALVQVNKNNHQVSLTGDLRKQVKQLTNNGYLKENITKKEVDTLAKELKKLKRTNQYLISEYHLDNISFDDFAFVEKQLDIVYEKLEIQASVNELFESKDMALNGAKIRDDLPLKSNLKDSEIIVLRRDLHNVFGSRDVDFQESIERLLATTEEQLRLKNSALDKLNKAQKEQHLTEIDQHYVEVVIDILNNEKDLLPPAAEILLR